MTPAKQLVPTILEYDKKSFSDWSKELRKYFSVVHVDVIDSSYGEQNWFDEVETFELLKGFESVIVHLMVEDPLAFLSYKKSFLRKDNARYLLHYKKVDDIEIIKNLITEGFKFGVFFELNDVVDFNNNHFQYFNEIMFMPIKAGASGRPSDLSMLETIDYFTDTHFDNLHETLISTDGGFSEDSMEVFIKSPVNIIYANTFFKTNGVEQGITKFTEKLKN